MSSVFLFGVLTVYISMLVNLIFKSSMSIKAKCILTGLNLAGYVLAMDMLNKITR